MTHLEKLKKYLEHQVKSKRELAELFAKTKDYGMAEKYLTEAREDEYILMLLSNESFLDKQMLIAEIFTEKTNDER